MKSRLLVSLLLLCFTVPVVALELDGSISGTARDSQGGALPGVTVTITDAGRALLAKVSPGHIEKPPESLVVSGTETATVSRGGRAKPTRVSPDSVASSTACWPCSAPRSRSPMRWRSS